MIFEKKETSVFRAILPLLQRTRFRLKDNRIFKMKLLSMLSTLALLTFTMSAQANIDVGLTVGNQAPAFELPDQNNTVHKLADYKGKTVVLAFYPADMTPGCTLEARSLNQALSDFAKR